jgi:hypothetical protein
MGKPWSQEEIKTLLSSIHHKKSIADIALEHERTKGSIESYRRKLAADYHFNDNRPIEEIQAFTGLTRGQIEDAIYRRLVEDIPPKCEVQGLTRDIEEYPLNYYDRCKVDWTPEEEAQVKQEYETESMPISEIGVKHKRTPGSIAYVLKRLGLIVHHAAARGYAEYRASSLFEEICIQYNKGKKERDNLKDERLKKKEELAVLKEERLKQKGDRKILECIVTTDSPMSELQSLKEDIAEMKKDIKQMLFYITSLYEFETSS